MTTWYSRRTRDGLLVGMEEGGAGYLLNGEAIRVIAGESITDGTAPRVDLPTCRCGASPQFRLPRLLAELLPCANRNLALRADEVAEVFAVWTYAVALDQPTKPILLFTGPPGSGKTSAARGLVQLLEGEDAGVSAMPKNLHDFEIAADRHRFLAIDNIDTKPGGWFLDLIAAIATGATSEHRRLYTNDDVVTFRMHSGLILTSMDVPFNRADILDRCLVIEMRRLAGYTPQAEMDARVIRLRSAFWSTLLHDLNHLIRAPAAAATENHQFRMADFAALGSALWRDRTPLILDVLSRAQADIALRDDEVFEALSRVARSARLSGRASGILERIRAGLPDSPTTKTAKAFGDYLRRISSAAGKVGVDISWYDDKHEKSKVYTIDIRDPQNSAADHQEVAGVAGLRVSTDIPSSRDHI